MNDKTTKDSRAVPGAQGIQRAFAVLREVAAREHEGARLMDIVVALELEHPTAHRLLNALVAEGLARRDAATRRYHLGHLVYEFGIGVRPHESLRQLCAPTLVQLARRTVDSIFLMVRSGLDMVCLDMIEGTYPIKANTLAVGQRRPLGVGAASLALLLTMPEHEVDAVLAINAARLPEYHNMSEQAVRSLLDASRATGYALVDGDTTAGVSAISVALRRPEGAPFAAITIGGVSSRFTLERRAGLAQMLANEVRAIERRRDVPAESRD
ncbi:IclR family transcriptional regulator [Caballeronia sp. LZ035]|uniref:IclR family transcriptional regulator n=1 Tax=Caballeronia sp. LZ035 TaxID=3038568 RepID=UPI00285801F5|nr:IclR family transcriptional regulator [Caballeronia sp. LZ035]MDR5760620.1 IclR family transcriptional regulator [Caballeronia sp. LZ035]